MIASYHDTYHRTIGRTLLSVNASNENAVRLQMYGHEEIMIEPKLKLGDKVRISKARHIFDKFDLLNWTEEIFTVSEVLRTVPVTNKLKNY